MFSPLFEALVNALGYLKGVGPKSAQRMAFQLLDKDHAKGLKLAKALEEAITYIKHCQQCRTLSESTLCKLCESSQRQEDLLCVVESPADILAIEQTQIFKGYYFVLHGHLSPIDGIGPQELGMHLLWDRLKANPIKELILATNPTMEGEATATYIAQKLQHTKIILTRIAHGVPLGGELEYLDGATLSRALLSRTSLIEEKDEH